jgi:ribosomal protein S18 acetylase RimI-like enzyme
MSCPDDGVTIRVATSGDIPAIHEVVHAAYRGEASRAGWTTEADLLDGIRTETSSIAAVIDGAPASLMLVAVDPSVPAGGVVGCCQLERRDDATAYFGMFAVAPRLQGGGLGRRLLGAAEDYATARWATRRMEMTVIVQREHLIAWYLRRGYTRTDETRPFPYGDTSFGLPRRDDLAFVVLRKSLPPTSS